MIHASSTTLLSFQSQRFLVRSLRRAKPIAFVSRGSVPADVDASRWTTAATGKSEEIVKRPFRSSGKAGCSPFVGCADATWRLHRRQLVCVIRFPPLPSMPFRYPFTKFDHRDCYAFLPVTVNTAQFPCSEGLLPPSKLADHSAKMLDDHAPAATAKGVNHQSSSVSECVPHNRVRRVTVRP